MKPVHPGRLLRREMQARSLSANALALALRVSSGRITDILNGKRGVSPETAMRLARYFGNSPRFWLNLQTTYELEVAEAELGERIAAEVAPAAAWQRLRTLARKPSSGRLRRPPSPGGRREATAT
jgi:antitoxin HigA-1